MAVRHGYGKIAGTDALVFAYDTGDTRNSYRGEPTENLFPYPQFTNHTNNVVGAASITKKDFGDGKIGIEIIQGSTSDIISFSMHSLSSAVSGATYTWSSYVHASKTSAAVKAQVTIRVDGVKYWLTNSNTWTTSVTECSHLFAPTVADQWHRVDNQFTMPTGTLTDFQLGGWYRNNSNYTLKLANVQLEVKSHPTQFLTGTRSATQGLLDLTGNSTIDLSNVSFDSNAQLNFDGTDDDIDAGIGTATSLQRTIEMVFKTNTIGYLYPLACYTRGGGQSIVGGKRMWLGFQSNKFQMHGWGTSDPSSTTTIQTGQYYHAVYAYDQDTKKHYIWINGVLENNSTNDQGGFTSWNNSGDHKWFIGGDPDCASWNASAGRSLNGEIPVFKVYNRILSNEEVRNNYRHYKKRFNI